MGISTWARYQNGVLKTAISLPLIENQRVRIIVLPLVGDACTECGFLGRGDYG
jgi:predicted DNA-binding antitoxin AbrB/MazE fold protein